MIGSAIGAVAGLAGITAVSASGSAPNVHRSAQATEPAVRLARDGLLEFPVDVGDGLDVLNNFGGRSTSNGACNHAGIDIGVPTFEVGRTLYACTDGFVRDIQPVTNESGTSPARGNAVVFEDAAGDVYRYHHLDRFVDGMKIGDALARGAVIGYMGRTGNTSWPHLHFEVRRGGPTGPAVDPVPLLPFPIEGVTLGAPTGCR